jgi:hypothetical protein
VMMNGDDHLSTCLLVQSFSIQGFLYKGFSEKCQDHEARKVGGVLNYTGFLELNVSCKVRKAWSHRCHGVSSMSMVCSLFRKDMVRISSGDQRERRNRKNYEERSR